MIQLKEQNHLSYDTIYRHLQAKNLPISREQVELVMDAVGDAVTKYQKSRPTLKAILTSCEKLVGMDLSSPSTKRLMVDARRFFFSVAREFGYGFAVIGKTLTPLKDHATVMHSIASHEDLMTSDKIYKELYNYRKEKLNKELYIDEV